MDPIYAASILSGYALFVVQEVRRRAAFLSPQRLRQTQESLVTGDLSEPIPISRFARGREREFMHLLNLALDKYISLRGHQRIINLIASVSETDAQGNITFVNDRFCQVCGYPREELLGKNHSLLSSGRHAAGFYQNMWETIGRGMIWRGDVCNRDYNGVEYWQSTAIAPLRDGHGGGVRYLSVGFDITARVHTDRALSGEKERWRVTLDSLGEGVIVTGGTGLIEFMNPRAESLLGVQEAQAFGVHVDGIFVVQVNGVRTNSHRSCAQDRESCDDDNRMLVTTSGRLIPVQITSSPIRSDDGSVCGCVMVFRDNSEHHSMTEELMWQARHDALTGLPNRRVIEEAIQTCLDSYSANHANAGVFCYIDLDNFKIVNDTCGHSVGDQLIKEVANVIQESMSRAHLLVRLGGDEFGLLIDRTTLDDALNIVNAMLLTLHGHHFRHQGLTFKSAASVGISVIDGTCGVAEIISHADTACFSAKQSGRRQVQVYSSGGHSNIAAEMQWVGRFDDSFKNRRFRLYRQRIVPVIPDGHPDHYEILLRHVSAEGRVEAPGQFLPAAERFGLSTAIDSWVVRTLIEYLSVNIDDTSDYSINLSGATLSDQEFMRILVELIEISPVDPRRLTFEVTETAVVHNLERAMAAMNAIRALGCTFSLDDFGSGLSSFGYIKEMPVDVIKIDGVFIRGLTHDGTDQAIVRAIASIGRALGKKTVAEFVEDDATLQLLREIGVDYAQGYGIHKPEPVPHVP